MNKRQVCPRCARPKNQCLCNFTKNININNQITILQDRDEAKHPLGTARLANLSCKSIEIITSDQINDNLLDKLFSNNSFLLFKNEYSRPLNITQLPSHNFIALDGTWKKSRKIYHTHPRLKELPCFHLEIEHQTIYHRIRKSCGKTHLSTLEAIAYTLLQLKEITTKEYEQFLEPLKELIRQQEEAISIAKSKVIK